MIPPTKNPPPDHAHEFARRARDGSALSRGNSQDDAEKHDGGTIVEQALALNEHAKPTWHPQGLEQRNHGDGIGSRQEGGEHKAVDELEVLDEMERSHHRGQKRRRHRDGGDHSRHGERNNCDLAPPEARKIEVKGCLEKQSRQKDREE